MPPAPAVPIEIPGHGLVAPPAGGPPGATNGGSGTDTDGADSAATVGPFRVGGDVSSPLLINEVRPEYPVLARRAHIAGVVKIEAVIRRDGKVDVVRVVQGLRMGCTQAALDALKRWRYTPGLRNGAPVDVVMDLDVVFQLDE